MEGLTDLNLLNTRSMTSVHWGICGHYVLTGKDSEQYIINWLGRLPQSTKTSVSCLRNRESGKNTCVSAFFAYTREGRRKKGVTFLCKKTQEELATTNGLAGVQL